MSRPFPLLITAVLVLFATGQACAQLLPFNNASPQQLVQSMLAGQGVSVSNVTLNGVPATSINDQVGSFNGVNSNIGLDSGLVICTGKVVMIEGPNMSPGTTVPPASPNNVADPDLTTLGIAMQNCVAALEFDFIPTGDSVSFRFVFGSEEYPEYVCSSFNDLFGFFISGPGINGQFTNQAMNMAVIPGTQVPVAINTVNPGVPGFGTAVPCAAMDPNWQANSIYYVSNAEPNPFNPTTTVELDGFTIPLIAIAAVQCGQTYHIKMVIAHATDSSLDSAVLIEAGSFSSSGSLPVSVTTPLNDGTLTEGCGEALVTVERPSTEGDGNIQVTYSGTGITAEDLAGNVAQVTIPDGYSSVTFPINAIRDQAAEGDEILMIIATWTSACGTTLTDSVALIIRDYTPMEITAQDLYLQCGTDSAMVDASVFGGLGEITMDWGSAGSGSPIYVPGLENATYTVTATDQCPESKSMEIQVNSGCDILIPNVITPNADGLNDTWVINGLYRSGSSVKVFNRWGNLVFTTANYANNWRGAGLPDGTYFYEVIDGRSAQRLTGSLTILSNGRK